MNAPQTLGRGDVDARVDGIIKLAIMAVGGQGGGVLTAWIETLARAQGYACQATSVAGVAQRTGATIYYIEIAAIGDGQPVFALAPASGDVDIVIAAELMEAGRAIIRGFVTPDKTTLIASAHRALAVSEKMAPGDGIANAAEVLAAAEIAADRVICFDMEALAVANDSVISATLFGALAASNCLPFRAEAFEDAIRAGGKGIESSLNAFAAAYDACNNGPLAPTQKTAAPQISTQPTGPQRMLDAWAKLVVSAAQLPEPSRAMAQAGLHKVVDFMDTKYGQVYLDHVQAFADLDDTENGFELTAAAAKYIANAMAYDDVIRVADLKTRGARVGRIATEMGAKEAQVMQVTEFMHPRAEEIVGLLPVRLGRRIESSRRAMARVDRWFARGRRLRSDKLVPFLMLYVLGGLKRYRRRTHRHAVEQAHLVRWLHLALDMAPKNYALAVEILCCQRLIKGYSDTHARGLSKFGKVINALPLIEARPDAADWLRRLRVSALQDEAGKALDGAIETVKTL